MSNTNETKSFEQVLDEYGTLCWTNVGVSMMPLLRQGRDIMIIQKRPACRLKKLDTVLFRRPGLKGRGAYVLHRIIKVNRDGTYYILGDNCYMGETVKEENVIGILTAVKRNGKTISVTDRGYLFYVHLWCDFYPVRTFILRIRCGIILFFNYVKAVLKKHFGKKTE